MKKFNLIFLLMVAPFWSMAQNNSVSLVEYFPAPGQHINIDLVGTPQAAEKMTEEVEKIVSLGGFGGYVILKFENACINDSQNPYGIDFNLFGNAFSGSSEPGVVWVMQDKNENGLPDDEWYEIAGSNYFHSETIKNYEVTYFETETRDILWKDALGQSGMIKANIFNLQDYYPLPLNFADYPQDSVKFTGTLLTPAIDSSNAMVIKNSALAFGYADNKPRNQGIELSIPDNPYSDEVEGAGGDPIDISWAVDSFGNYVDLDSIHFVKIVSGVLTDAGRLGEISTDVMWLADVMPGTEVSEENELLVVYHHTGKMLVGDTMLLESNYFRDGIILNESINFTSQDELIAEIDENGYLFAKTEGEVMIQVSAGNEMKTEILKVVAPDSIKLLSDFSSLYPGDSVLLDTRVFDNEGEIVNVPVVYSSSNSEIAKIVQNESQYWLHALQPGEIDLTFSFENYLLQKSIKVKVLSDEDKINVYFSIKTASENLFPFQWIEVGEADLNSFVGDREQDYSGLNRLTLFHALVAGLSKADVNFEFRDNDAANGSIYLYSIERDDIFTYGWGGKTDPLAFARGWIARLNNSQFINSYNNIEISDGDTVDLYHVADISVPWIYSRLLVNKDSAAVDEEIELLMEQSECSISNQEIAESELVPVNNAEIIFEGYSIYTGINGKVTIQLGMNPPVVFYSANNAVLVKERVTTATTISEFSQLNIFPNPVEDILTVETSDFQKFGLKLMSMDGKVLNEYPVQSQTSHINMEEFSPGIYLLVVLQNEKTEIFKMIKK